MRFWDSDFDRQFDEAVDELFWEQKARENAEKQNISNQQKLIGAQ